MQQYRNALFTALACAGAAWAINAGSVLAPEPADLSDPLAGGAGATAQAVFTQEYRPSPVLLWPGTFTSGGPIVAAGTPCSTSVLAPGQRTTKRIQLNLSGTQKRCVDYNNLNNPPANWPRPLPTTQLVTDDKAYRAQIDGIGVKLQPAVATTVPQIVLVVLWPADWLQYDAESVPPIPRPYPGQPCSDFEMYAGETTYKHIQLNNDQTGNVFGYYRCVAMTEPTQYPNDGL